jgi:hypothetical protein
MPSVLSSYEFAPEGKIYEQSRKGGYFVAEDRDDLDSGEQGRNEYFMDIDRMVNEGLGGGNVTLNNGLIEETTTDTMHDPESVLDAQGEEENA